MINSISFVRGMKEDIYIEGRLVNDKMVFEQIRNTLRFVRIGSTLN